MAEERVQRRLVAILAADVVGYSQLIEADEEGTRARFRSLYSELIDPKIAADDGRIVKTTGDGVLVEFSSAVDAVRSALDIQEAIRQRNADLPEDHCIAFRMGINLGDIIVEGDDIHGDGVNVAARLEVLCGPGEVYVSGTVREHVEGKLSVVFDDLGERTLKNIARSVHVFVARSAADTGAAEDAASAALTLPDKPSIAVLAFENMSGDSEQEYFSDGISEDIITGLSRFHWLFVIARNSSFAYKGQALDVKRIARDLGVQYVLEGSVRKSGDQVRVTAQLIDAPTGHHVWAERYDRKLEDIFLLQDELTESIVGAIEPELAKSERERARAKRPENLHAWDLLQQGMWHTYRRTKEDLAAAQSLFRRAQAMDPAIALAYAGAAIALFYWIVDGYAADRDRTIEEAIAEARRAVDLDSRDAMVRYALGRAYHIARRHDEAIPEFEVAIELNPNFAHAYFGLGFALNSWGRHEDGIPLLETAIRLSPHDPHVGQWMAQIALAKLSVQQHEAALIWARQSLRQPNVQWSRWVFLISALGHLGRTEEAGRAIDALHRLNPELGPAFIKSYWPIVDAAALAHLLDGLRKAGLPE